MLSEGERKVLDDIERQLRDDALFTSAFSTSDPGARRRRWRQGFTALLAASVVLLVTLVALHASTAASTCLLLAALAVVVLWYSPPLEPAPQDVTAPHRSP